MSVGVRLSEFRLVLEDDEESLVFFLLDITEFMSCVIPRMVVNVIWMSVFAKHLLFITFSLHFHKMSLVLTSLHPSSLELRYLVPPCPGVCCWGLVMKECVGWSVRVARLCVVPLGMLRGVEPREDSLLALAAIYSITEG